MDSRTPRFLILNINQNRAKIRDTLSIRRRKLNFRQECLEKGKLSRILHLTFPMDVKMIGKREKGPVPIVLIRIRAHQALIALINTCKFIEKTKGKDCV
jgi:hypothetical protein